MIGASVVASKSVDPAVQVRMKEQEIEGLKLQIVLQKLKLQFRTRVEVEWSDMSRLAWYAGQ